MHKQFAFYARKKIDNNKDLLDKAKSVQKILWSGHIDFKRESASL